MEEKPSKSLDGVAFNKKRKRATQCVQHLTGVSAPTSVVVKQMRLAGDVHKPNASDPGISKSLIKYYLNYKKSGMLKRLLFYKNGEWLDYLEDVVDLVKKDFKIKKAVVEVELDGQKVLLDFLHMYHVYLKTGLQQPIAWIDEEENYFFPKVCGAACAMVHSWLLSLHSSLFQGIQLPKFVNILTGWGKHSKEMGVGTLKKAVEALLNGLGSPFRIYENNLGRLVSSGEVLTAWLTQPGVFNSLVLYDVLNHSQAAAPSHDYPALQN